MSKSVPTTVDEYVTQRHDNGVQGTLDDDLSDDAAARLRYDGQDIAQYGYQCEDCEVAVFPTTTRNELRWLKDRLHVVREVAKHANDGLDSWMMEGLVFLDEHVGHSVVLVSRR